ncbi:uncharacterized protein LOC111250214 [Varroa destructor]|uniref:DNA polymerase delta subunit 3 n=1 Tax=Varroa destructor TaxID=109461 RepID=A0A7M7K3A6_VARDE|nr:uncharacterized protein LOC111250214 [Varroa destructor]
MTESAIRKEVADLDGKLCNVASLAATLKLAANEVKKHFPVNNTDQVVTGERRNGFAVVLISGGSMSKTAFVDTVWSSHAYQSRIVCDVKKKNSTYIELLATRPSPVIQSVDLIRDRLVRTKGDDQILKDKAPAQFFTEKKQEVKQGKKCPISQMFIKIPTDNGAKDEPKEGLGQVKNGQEGSTEKESVNGIKKEKKTSVETAESCSKIKSNDEQRKLSTKSNQSQPQSGHNNFIDVNMTEDDNSEDITTKINKKLSPKDMRASEKRKNSSPNVSDQNDDIDYEVTVSRGKKKKRRVAIESDSGEESEPSLEPQAKAKETKQTLYKNTNEQKSKITLKKSRELLTGIADVDERNHKDVLGKFKENLLESKQRHDKKRRRVLKEFTHTFEDEEGYLQVKTTKEIVSETDSEPEEKSTDKLKSAIKPVLIPKGQSSIFAFFKKQ